MNDHDLTHSLTEELVDTVARRLDTTAPVPPSAPSRELLDKAWEAARRQARWKPVVVWREFHRQLLAAAGEGVADTPMHVPENVDEECSQWTVTREDRVGDDEQKVLRFRAHPDHVAAYAGRRIEIQVGRDVFDLGVIDSNGAAAGLIPSGISLRQAIDLRIGVSAE